MSAIAAVELPEPICISVLEAETRNVLYQLLDETPDPKAVKYRNAFDEAVRTFPDRHIVVVRVPLETWDAAA